jgi:hypothetical protein
MFIVLNVQLNEEVIEGTVWVRDRDRAICMDMALSDAHVYCDTNRRD